MPMICRIRNALVLAGALALTALPSLAHADSGPFQNDPMGRLRDVTGHWRHYQPAGLFCIKPSATTYTPGGDGATATGKDRACRRSGFPRRARGLVKVHVRTPSLCTGCRRFFIDFSKIPKTAANGNGHAQGHAYYHLDSINNTYTVDAKAHSPNTKNFTNDKLIAPNGSPQVQVIGAWDLHAIEYVTDTRNFIHTASQGPLLRRPVVPEPESPAHSRRLHGRGCGRRDAVAESAAERDRLHRGLQQRGRLPDRRRLLLRRVLRLVGHELEHDRPVRRQLRWRITTSTS